jgi:hypothetical protein
MGGRIEREGFFRKELIVTERGPSLLHFLIVVFFFHTTTIIEL